MSHRINEPSPDDGTPYYVDVPLRDVMLSQEDVKLLLEHNWEIEYDDKLLVKSIHDKYCELLHALYRDDSGRPVWCIMQRAYHAHVAGLKRHYLTVRDAVKDYRRVFKGRGLF